MTKALDIITYYVKMFGKLVFYGWLVWFRHIWPIALLYQILEESDSPISVGATGTGIVKKDLIPTFLVLHKPTKLGLKCVSLMELRS